MKKSQFGLRYPVELVSRLGAKAGILEYVKQHLPDIPQAHSIVKTPAEAIDDALGRADAAGIKYPRMYRSSAIEELNGFEGDFPTIHIPPFGHKYGPMDAYHNREHFEEAIRSRLSDVENSPLEVQSRGHKTLSDKICVIIAEQSDSKYSGTLVRHPNKTYTAISIHDKRFGDSTDDRNHAGFLCGKDGLYRLKDFSNMDFAGEKRKVYKQLSEVNSWHDRIAALPEMDKSWAYQLEFGILPLCLYQVRPFKPLHPSPFQVKAQQEFKKALVFGVTDSRGITAKIEMPYSLERVKDDAARAYVGPMRLAHHATLMPNHAASFLSNSWGFLAHDDVKALRQAQVTVMYLREPEFVSSLSDGDHIRLIADGERVHVERYTPRKYV